MSQNEEKSGALDPRHLGWKNNLSKKAMEQEFSPNLGGLAIALSIAFLIVLISALAMRFLYQAL